MGIIDNNLSKDVANLGDVNVNDVANFEDIYTHEQYNLEYDSSKDI